MRASLVAVVAVLAMTTPVVAATLTPNEIQAAFFTGQPFTASATNVKYKMVFSADGKMTREPVGTAGSPHRRRQQVVGDERDHRGRDLDEVSPAVRKELWARSRTSAPLQQVKREARGP